MLIIATTIMSCCSSTTLQKCSTATMPRNLCMPSAALLLSVARWQQPCLSLQLHLGDFAVHTALQNCRSDAQQPCPETCAYPLQPCCSQWQGGNSLAHHCNYTCELLQFYSPAEVQHSNHAHKPVHALCSTAAVSGKVATALLIIATTPMSRCSSTALQNCRSAAQQPCPETCASLCSTTAVSGKVATALLVTAITIMSCSSSTTLQKCSTATMPRNLCMPFAALLLSVARWQQPCSSLQLQL